MQVLALYYDSKFIMTVLNEILNRQELSKHNLRFKFVQKSWALSFIELMFVLLIDKNVYHWFIHFFLNCYWVELFN